MRIGLGYACFPLSEDSGFIIGGVSIIAPAVKSPQSEQTDVVSLAVSDALLGAAGLGGVSNQFPDLVGSPSDKGLNLLKEVEQCFHYTGYKIINLDLTIISENTEILSFTDQMVNNLSNILFIKPELINIKVTRNTAYIVPENGSVVCCMSIALIK